MENPFNKKIEWKHDGRTFGWGASPDADWKVIFLATFFLIVVVAAWDVFTYFKVKSGDLSASDVSGETELPKLNSDSLKNILEYYADKADELEKIKAGTSSTMNPSDPSV